MVITDELKERIDKFFVMKSLVDENSFNIKYNAISIKIKKGSIDYLSIYKPLYNDDKILLHIHDEVCSDYLVKKYNFQNVIYGYSLDELVMFIERYMMDA